MVTEGMARVIAEHPFCAGMAPDDLALLAGCASNVKFQPGELLARNGDEADRSYLIRAGRVAMVVHGREIAETAEEGDLIGWSWLFPPYRWHFDARALTSVRAVRLDGACLRRKCENDPRFGFDVTRRILHQVTLRLERARLHALDVYQGAPR